MAKRNSSKKQWKRRCPNPTNNPKCEVIMYYNHYHNYQVGIKVNGRCAKCRNIGHKFSEESRKKMSASHKGKYTGADNPFFGKHHTEETKQKLRERPISDEHREKIRQARLGTKASAEARANMSKARAGRKLSAEHAAAIKLANQNIEYRQFMSNRMRGSNNPMYGKPSPSYNGNHVAGWYKGVLFRSSCELQFLLTHPNVNWELAETGEFCIPYIHPDGTERTYFTDYVGDGFLVEVKTQGWITGDFHNGLEMEAKARAAVEFCKEKGLQYIRCEIASMKKKDIFALRNSNTITLNKRWEAKYQEWKAKQAG